jgi:hypothetical protein
MPPGRSHRMTDSSSLASAVRFSVTDEMRSIAGQQSHHGISIVVTSFLVGAPNKHTYGATSFAQLSTGRLPNGSIAWKSPASRVYGVVDKLRSVSPALCTPNTALLVAHDVAGIPAVKDGVRYHHVEPDATSNSMNRRWEIYSRILREYTFDCVCAHAPLRAMLAARARHDRACSASRRCYRRDRCRCPMDAVLPCAAREVGDWLGWCVDGREAVAAEAGSHVRSTQQHDGGVPARGKVGRPNRPLRTVACTQKSQRAHFWQPGLPRAPP